jgi:hypothetical protein
VLIVDERKSRDRDAALRPGADGFDVLDGATSIHTGSYREVIGLYYSHSKEPRWTMADGRSAAVARAGSIFGFLKGRPTGSRCARNARSSRCASATRTSAASRTSSRRAPAPPSSP